MTKYAECILNEDAKFIVALDSDYRFISGNLNNHTRILETQCHSIENLMFCAANIASIIRALSHNIEYSLNEVETWLEHFDKSIYILMVADFIIERDNLGKKCMGDNCSRFVEKSKGCLFVASEIKLFTQNLCLQQEDLDKTSLDMKHYKPRFHSRGHFFFSAVHSFVKCETKRLLGKSVTVSNDSLYALSVNSCQACCIDNSWLQNLRDQAVAAAKEVVGLLNAKSV